MSLKINNLNKSFGDKCILNSFSYVFDECGIYAIVGESGVGKTTLLRMIAGLDTKYSGEILGGGFKNISFAFQEYRLFPALSALDNVIYAIADKKDFDVELRARNMLKRLGFTDSDTDLFPSELSAKYGFLASLLFHALIIVFSVLGACAATAKRVTRSHPKRALARRRSH